MDTGGTASRIMASLTAKIIAVAITVLVVFAITRRPATHLSADTLWSFLLAVQALIVTALLADGRFRILACWVGLATEPLWIVYAFIAPGSPWGFAFLGGVYLATYVWGIVRDQALGQWVRERIPARSSS